MLPVTGSLLVIAGAETDIYNGANGRAFTGLDSRYPAVPDLPVPVSYPQTATFALLSLEPVNDYAPEVGCCMKVMGSVPTWKMMTGT